MKKYALPFNGPEDLTEAYEKIMGAFKNRDRQAAIIFDNRGIKWTPLHPVGIAIEYGSVPADINLVELVAMDKIEEVYREVGVEPIIVRHEEAGRN